MTTPTNARDKREGGSTVRTSFDIERARQLREHVANAPAESFDMSTWLNGPLWDRPQMNCGTAGCLLGHAAYLWSEDVEVSAEEPGEPYLRHHESGNEGELCMADLLGLSTNVAYNLTAWEATAVDEDLDFPVTEPDARDDQHATRETALARLDYLIAHGGTFDEEPTQ